MKKNFLCMLSVLLLAGCASSDRMMRLSPTGARAYKAPDSIRLQSKKYQKMEHAQGEKKTLAEENVVNVWPFFLKNDYFHAILWPFIDYDQYGVAVRPFYNKEGDEHSILFPLSGWNSADGSGWVFNTFWSKDKFTVFPFFHSAPNYMYAFPVIKGNYNNKEKTLSYLHILPFSYFFQEKDKKEYGYILLPLGGWLVLDGDTYGLILNTYWGKDYFGMVPLFHYSDDSWMALLAYKNSERYGFFPLFAQNLANDGGYFFPFYIYSTSENKSFVNAMLLYNYYRRSNGKVLDSNSYSDTFVFPVLAGQGESFKLLNGSVNYYFFKELDKQCSAFKEAFEKSDMKGVADSRGKIAELLKVMKIDKDFTAPQNIAELNEFSAAFKHKFGTVIDKNSFSILPFFNKSNEGKNREWSLLFGLLHKSKYYQDYEKYSLPNAWSMRRNSNQVLEEDSSRTLLLVQSSETLNRNFKYGVSQNESIMWQRLYSQLRDLAVYMEHDEFNLWKKDPKYKSSTAKQHASVREIADKLGITLPELKTPAQCYIFRKEIEGMCLDYFKVSNTSLMPFFEIESSDKGGKFEIFPFFYTEKYKIGNYGEKDRTNVFMLCHNQTVKNKIPQGKFQEVFKQIDRFERSLCEFKVEHKLPKALKSANLAFAMPKNFRECNELRQKLYALIPENTERISTLLPFYYYKGNDVLDDSYLNILGIFYNGGHKKQDSWFNVLGFVARGYKEKDEEEFRILEFLYRSRKRNDEKDYLIFPFFYYRESPLSSQFSFLHRIVNIEKTASGTKGHIFYIPFGE